MNRPNTSPYYRNMSGDAFDIAVTDIVLGRMEGRTVRDLVAAYGVPNPRQWEAIKELCGFVRGKIRRAAACAKLQQHVKPRKLQVERLESR